MMVRVLRGVDLCEDTPATATVDGRNVTVVWITEPPELVASVDAAGVTAVLSRSDGDEDVPPSAVGAVEGVTEGVLPTSDEPGWPGPDIVVLEP